MSGAVGNVNGTLAAGEERLRLAAMLWDWQPHPGQRQLLTMRLADGSEPRTLVAACGRRWGKTEGLSVDVATRLLLEPDLAQLIVGPTKDQADGLFDAVWEKLSEILTDKERLERFPHLAGYEFRRSPYSHIRRKSDGQIVLSARSAANNGRNLRGKGTTRKMKRFRVVIDEAAFVADKAINEVIRPMLATGTPPGQLVMISSPCGRRGAFYDAYLRGERQEGHSAAVRLPSAQNPLVDAEFLHEMEQELTPRQFAAEFLATFVDQGGAVFPGEDIDACTIEDDYGSDPLAGITYIAGVDLARRGDYTVVIVGAVEAGANGEQTRVRVVALERLTGLGWRCQLDRVCDILQHWQVRRVCPDRTGIGDMPVETMQAEILARRLPCEVEGFLFTESSKRHLVDGLAIGLSKGRLRFPRHPVLLSELANFEVLSVTANGHERMAARVGHDDTVMALGLMWEAAAPYVERRSGLIGAATGGRLIGATGRKEFSKRCEEEISTGGGFSLESVSRGVKRSRHPPLWRIASVVSRYAVGRVVLARLHQFFHNTSG